MRVIYEDTDITDDVSVAHAWLDLFAEGKSDRLTIQFGDTQNVWGDWEPKPGEIISVEDVPSNSGAMKIVNVRPRSSLMEIEALAVPNEAITERRSKSWQYVHLSQIVTEIAMRYGMGVEVYGATDYGYEYVEQTGEPDFAFLTKRCTLEGYSCLAFNGDIVIYSGEFMEAQEPNGALEVTPGDDYKIKDDSFEKYGACKVTDGRAVGSFQAGDGKLLEVQLVDRISSPAEATRFAHGLLRSKNRQTNRIKITTDSFLGQFAPGSVIDLSAPTELPWQGKAFIEKARFDFYAQKTMIEVRPVLEGY